MQSLTVPAAPTSARAARRFVAAVCGGLDLPPGVCEDAVLMVSELVGNVFLHARGTAQVDVSFDAPVLHVAVTDDDPEPPVARPPGSDAVSGRGVHIVEALASSWGVTPRVDPPPGKAVWFDLHTDPAAVAAARHPRF